MNIIHVIIIDNKTMLNLLVLSGIGGSYLIKVLHF